MIWWHHSKPSHMTCLWHSKTHLEVMWGFTLLDYFKAHYQRMTRLAWTFITPGSFWNWGTLTGGEFWLTLGGYFQLVFLKCELGQMGSKFNGMFVYSYQRKLSKFYMLNTVCSGLILYSVLPGSIFSLFNISHKENNLVPQMAKLPHAKTPDCQPWHSQLLNWLLVTWLNRVGCYWAGCSH